MLLSFALIYTGLCGAPLANAQNFNGSVAGQPSHDLECQSITMEFLANAGDDGASAPHVVPAVRNLGCDYYPLVSYRLDEQGRVVVEARILPDGSVADAKLALPHGSSRLNDAALGIVRNRLVISPAIRDGKSVETTRQIAVTFKLTHFMHGFE